MQQGESGAGRGARAGAEGGRVAVTPWVGSRARVSPCSLPPTPPQGPRGALTELDVADGAPQVLLGHDLAHHHEQVELAVEEAMRQAGRGGRRRGGEAAGRLGRGGFHHHGRHPAGPRDDAFGEVARSGRSSPLRQEKGVAGKVAAALRPLRAPLLRAPAARRLPDAPGANARCGRARSERGRGRAAAFIRGTGPGAGRRRRKRRRKGPPGTSSRGGCRLSSSRWPRADVIRSKSCRPGPGSWRN